MTVVSMPACRRFTAVVCLRVCIVTCLPLNDGQDPAAVWIWIVSRCSMASRESGLPWGPGNTVLPGRPLRSVCVIDYL
jgi:hypothetical protein